MKKLTIYTQERVLHKLINMVKNCGLDHLYRPKGFEKNFPYLSEQDLQIILDILDNKNLIHVEYADYPDSFGIYTLSITPNGYDYYPQKSLSKREKWKERFIGFLSGVLITVIGGVILNILLK